MATLDTVLFIIRNVYYGLDYPINDLVYGRDMEWRKRLWERFNKMKLPETILSDKDKGVCRAILLGLKNPEALYDLDRDSRRYDMELSLAVALQKYLKSLAQEIVPHMSYDEDLEWWCNRHLTMA